MNPSGSCQGFAETIELYAMGRLVGEQVTALEEHLLLCSHCQQRLTEEEEFWKAFRSVQRSGENTGSHRWERERRTQPRFRCFDKVLVRVSPGQGGATESPGYLKDLSGSGACIQLDFLVPAGARLEFLQGDVSLVGVVRYCSRVGDSFKAGVELVPESQWDPLTYLPANLELPDNLRAASDEEDAPPAD